MNGENYPPNGLELAPDFPALSSFGVLPERGCCADSAVERPPLLVVLMLAGADPAEPPVINPRPTKSEIVQ